MEQALIVFFGLIALLTEIRWGDRWAIQVTTIIGVFVTLMAILGGLGLADFSISFGPNK